MSWTRFDADGTSYIYLAYSSDYGESFSEPRLVSRNSALCSNALGVPTPLGACNTNQFSQPFTGPDGALYVTWANYNVTGTGPRGDEEGEGGDRLRAPAEDNRAQMLLARSTDGGATFSSPIKVADFYDLPDCETYQNGNGGGSSCVPEKGATSNSFFRAAQYPTGAVNPRDDDEVIVTFGSYINRHSNEANGCVPTGFNKETLLPLYTGRQDRRELQQRHCREPVDGRGQEFHRPVTDVRRLPSARDDDPRADQWWQWAEFDRRRAAGRLVL